MKRLTKLVALVLTVAGAHHFAGARMTPPNMQSISCETALIPEDVTIYCVTECAAGCETILPVPDPLIPNATSSYCHCSNGSAAEPRCCHLGRVWLANGSFSSHLRGVCGDACGGKTCSLMVVEVEGTAGSVGRCITVGL